MYENRVLYFYQRSGNATPYCLIVEGIVNTELLKQQLEPIFKSHQVKCQSISWLTQHKEKVLEVAVYKEDAAIDLELISALSHDISLWLDEHVDTEIAYTLDVCSSGIERPLESLDQIKAALNRNVYVRTSHSIDKKIEFIGRLVAVDDEHIEVMIRDKHKEKKIVIAHAWIEFIRLAAML